MQVNLYRWFYFCASSESAHVLQKDYRRYVNSKVKIPQNFNVLGKKVDILKSASKIRFGTQCHLRIQFAVDPV